MFLLLAKREEVRGINVRGKKSIAQRARPVAFNFQEILADLIKG